MFTEQDTACIRAHGLTPEAVERQLENFRRGFPFLKVVRAAAPGDGILVPAPQEVAAAVRRYDEASWGALSGDAVTAARQINQAMERLVRECPRQYLWSYDRYKSPAVHHASTDAPLA